MPSFPPPGSVTICEINRDLITSENLSDDRAKDTYGKILGHVFSPVQFQTDHLASPLGTEQGNEQEERTLETVQRKSLSTALKAIFSGSLNSLFGPNDVSSIGNGLVLKFVTCTLFGKFVKQGSGNLVKLLPKVDLHSLSWHQHKNILAFISGPHHVTIRDYEDSDGKDPCVLINDSQRDVKLLEWRPNGGKTLSVACKGGICIWAASYPGNAASVRSGVTLGTLSRGSGTRWVLVDFLRCPDDKQISALSWSPDGRYPN
ncbi:unnamed protein product [Ilex paraguariensis]|uniref:Aladin n=1 Tax=Ilex paraguariensis TaxID=185542 RepID=A0ABC8RNL5_9AQUA